MKRIGTYVFDGSDTVLNLNPHSPSLRALFLDDPIIPFLLLCGECPQRFENGRDWQRHASHEHRQHESTSQSAMENQLSVSRLKSHTQANPEDSVQNYMLNPGGQLAKKSVYFQLKPNFSFK